MAVPLFMTISPTEHCGQAVSLKPAAARFRFVSIDELSTEADEHGLRHRGDTTQTTPEGFGATSIASHG
jgi:hypothetical protein